MSVEVRPGSTVPKDPSAKSVFHVAWDDWLGALADGEEHLLSGTVTIEGPDDELTYDNDGLISGNLRYGFRLIGGTAGAIYTVTNHVVTDGTPAQEDDRSFFVRIVNR